jgi:hypothetical protein
MSSGKFDREKEKALLAHREREMLTQEVDITDQVRWKRHERIRNRLKQTIYDFRLLGGRNHHNWDEINLGKIFNEEEMDLPKARDGARGMIYVLYRGLFEDHMPPFEPYLQDGIALAELHMNDRHVFPSLSIDRQVGGTTIEEVALDKVEQNRVDSMRIPEMRAVLNELANSDVNVAEIVRKERDGEPLFGCDEN